MLPSEIEKFVFFAILVVNVTVTVLVVTLTVPGRPGLVAPETFVPAGKTTVNPETFSVPAVR